MTLLFRDSILHRMIQNVDFWNMMFSKHHFLPPYSAGCISLDIDSQRQVKSAAEDGQFVLTLGGDHSIGVGSVAGLLAARPNTVPRLGLSQAFASTSPACFMYFLFAEIQGIIWVDAHADINTPLTSSSGE